MDRSDRHDVEELTGRRAGPRVRRNRVRRNRGRRDEVVTLIAVANTALTGVPAAYAASQSVVVTGIAALAGVAVVAACLIARRR